MSDTQERIAVYIEDRLKGYLSYYDNTARRMKRRHLQNRAAAAIAAVLIPVVSNLPWVIPIGSGSSMQIATVGASLLGLAVALILALEGVFHFKEQWQNCRGTEQYFLSQRFRFDNRVDEYEPLSDEDAFRLFVSKVEKAILDENNITLNILGRSEAGPSPK